MVGQFRVLPLILGELVHPSLAGIAAAPSNALGKAFVNSLRHEKLSVFWPTVIALGKADLFLAQRLAMRRTSVLLMWSAISDVTIHHEERRPVGRCLETAKCTSEAFRIIGIADARHVPAIAEETHRDVFAKRQRCIAFDGDVIVVVNPAKIRKL